MQVGEVASISIEVLEQANVHLANTFSFQDAIRYRCSGIKEGLVLRLLHLRLGMCLDGSLPCEALAVPLKKACDSDTYGHIAHSCHGTTRPC